MGVGVSVIHDLQSAISVHVSGGGVWVGVSDINDLQSALCIYVSGVMWYV